jgi:DMSO/TMAO reductase YedYZ molybdopterin-dependent catalytic subunit
MIAFKKIIRSVLMVLVPLLVITGVFKFLELYHIIAYAPLPLFWINFTHDWAGIIIVVLAFTNLIAGRITVSPKNKFFGIRAKIWFLIIFLVLAGVAGVLFIRLRLSPDNATKKLTASQVTQYQGEKLSSIADIQDNAINGTQRINGNTYSLEISGLVQAPKKYTYDQVLNFQKYSKVVELDCVEGWNAKILWEGVLVKDLLVSAGMKAQAKIVIFYASDGYTTSLPLDYIEKNNILLAYKMNNVVIPAEKGFPFQLVAEQKWGYKWIKWITKIELSDDSNYKGTWEQAGYNNNGDVNGPKLGN